MDLRLTNPNDLFFCDNGALYCGSHLGASARFTGRDVSGQKIAKAAAADLRQMAAEIGRPVGCEVCDALARAAARRAAEGAAP